MYAKLLTSSLEQRMVQRLNARPWAWHRFIDDGAIISAHGEEKMARFKEHMISQ